MNADVFDSAVAAAVRIRFLRASARTLAASYHRQAIRNAWLREARALELRVRIIADHCIAEAARQQTRELEHGH